MELATCWINPVINTDAPDPGILYFQGSFYVAVTGGNGPDDKTHYPIRKSVDLVNWEDVGFILTEENKPSWAIGDVIY